MNDFEKDYRKTCFAMKALASAVKEEAKDEEDFRALAMTAIGGATMALVLEMNETGDAVGIEEITDALTMLDIVRERTMNAAMKMGGKASNELN